MLESLKEISLTFKIDPQQTVGHAATAKSVVKVLNDLIKSYENFIEIEFLKNDHFSKVYSQENKVLELVRKDLELLVVDLEFSSFSASLAPNLLSNQVSAFNDHVLDWKGNSFIKYKNLITADYNNNAYVEEVIKEYTSEERKRIYAPIFDAIGEGKDYSLYMSTGKAQEKRRLIKPVKSKLGYYIQKQKVIQEPEQVKTVQVYAKVTKKGDEITFDKKALKEVLFVEEMEHDTYPYKPDILKFGEHIYPLNRALDCVVFFEDGVYVIFNDELDITVWGDTRIEAEEAFKFSFHALYQNYAMEQDYNLSDDSILLKNKLLDLVTSKV